METLERKRLGRPRELPSAARICVVVTREQEAALQGIAAKRGVSVSNVTRRAVDSYLETLGDNE